MRYLLFLFCVSLIFTSCSREDEISNQDLDYAKIEQLLSMDAKTQKLAYGTLNAHEKYYVWSSRISEIRRTDINPSQTLILNKIEKHLTLDFFYNSRIIEDKENPFFSLKDQVIQEFGFTRSKIYFTSLDKIDLTKLGINDLSLGDGGGPTPCECNVGDDWCVWGSSCFAGFCTQSNDGCGWWLEEPCTGRCASNP